jgi:hypothetical protein
MKLARTIMRPANGIAPNGIILSRLRRYAARHPRSIWFGTNCMYVR